MMKKSQYLSFLLVFLSVLTGKAQTNTYNMVIEMTNGTKINIGPNEIKNISFNEGQMTFSGESLSYSLTYATGRSCDKNNLVF